MKYIPCYLKLRLEGDYAIVMTKEYQLFLLNKMGYEILVSIKKYEDLCDVVNYLSDLYDVDSKRIKKDIHEYIHFMIKNKLVTTHEEELR